MGNKPPAQPKQEAQEEEPMPCRDETTKHLRDDERLLASNQVSMHPQEEPRDEGHSQQDAGHLQQEVGQEECPQIANEGSMPDTASISSESDSSEMHSLLVLKLKYGLNPFDRRDILDMLDKGNLHSSGCISMPSLQAVHGTGHSQGRRQASKSCLVTHLENLQEQLETERRILEAFRRKDKDEVVSLLPHVHQPHLIRDKGSLPSGYTLLHHAAQCGWLDVCHTLVEDHDCNARDTDAFGLSVLHTACLAGHPSVVKYLLTLKSVSATVSDRDRLGRTPMECVQENKYELLSLFVPHVQLNMELLVYAVFNIFIAGNSRAGKTTLTAVLKERLSYSGRSGMISNIKEHTAGIIPTPCDRVIIGPFNTVIYDLAGHAEFYSSHAAILETLIRKTPAIFLILVDLSKAVGDIKKELHYWTSFLEIQSYKIASHTVIVGSHVDKLASDPQQLKEKSEYVEQIAKHTIQKEHFAGFVPLDCRQLSEDHVQPLLDIMRNSFRALTTPVMGQKMSFSCHLLHGLLTDKVSKTAMTLKDLMELIAIENQPALPSDPETVATSLEILADKNLILFHRDSFRLLSSCIVIKQRDLLEEVNGKLFAPDSFKEHCKIASNTGIVPVSLLHETFPDYDQELLVVLLRVLEFCHELDPIVLKTISTNLSTGSASGERFLFFPALVDTVLPIKLAIAKGFGWAVFCKNPHQILTTRVLQVILLRLAFKFCLPKRKLPEVDLPRTCILLPLARECTVWKNGIHWKTEDGLEAVVEVSEQHRRVSVIVSCDESNITEHIKLRSSLIAEILAILQEFCPHMELEEYVIPSCEVMQLLDRDLAKMNVFSMLDVTRCFLYGKETVLSVDMKKEEPLSSLLFSDPYQLLHSRVVQLLFDKDKSSQLASESILRAVHGHVGVTGSISLSAKPTHQDLQEQLNKLSVFAGRNPLDVGGVFSADLPPSDIASSTLTEKALDEHDLQRVLAEIESVTEVESLGLNLGLLISTIDEIEQDYATVKKRRIQIIKCWLRRTGIIRKMQTCAPTWRQLADAVTEQNQALSDHIRSKYCS